MMGRGRPRKVEVVDRPKSAEDYTQEIAQPVIETPRSAEVKVSKVVRFKGTGTKLINGDVIGFKRGEYATENAAQVAALEKAGYERLA